MKLSIALASIIALVAAAPVEVRDPQFFSGTQLPPASFNGPNGVDIPPASNDVAFNRPNGVDLPPGFDQGGSDRPGSQLQPRPPISQGPKNSNGLDATHCANIRKGFASDPAFVASLGC